MGRVGVALEGTGFPVDAEHGSLPGTCREAETESVADPASTLASNQLKSVEKKFSSSSESVSRRSPVLRIR